MDQSTLAARLTDPWRLASLNASGLMDGPREPDFDRVTRLVRNALGVDVSLISLVDQSRQYFKSTCGLTGHQEGLTQTPLSHSFCQYVVGRQAALEVEDARRDPLLADNLAIQDLNVIGYLGVPIRSPDRQVLGSLCALQSQPRRWEPREREILEDCAKIIEELVAQRMLATQAIALAQDCETMAGELNHRVKNLLAVVMALVRLSKREAGSMEDLAHSIELRLRAYGSAHDALALGSLGFAELLALLLAPYSSAHSVPDVSGCDVMLAPSQAMPNCLIVHELATNSAKYGSLAAGVLPTVRWTVNNGEAVVVWSEPFNGAAGEPMPNENAGFGTRLLGYAAKQLSGEWSRLVDGPTLRVTWTFPVVSGA